ncbi:MAG: hypothetical protein LBE38_00960 [Deltaproteobacteria bacterium]|jgi:hypothetical protein|nr:hypothetical protein [Deltaproteobacteria bacterium]
MAYQLLHITSLSEYYPESYEGLTITSCYALISQLLDAELSPEASQILAEPVEKAKKNSIEWHTPLEGTIKAYGTLQGEEKDMADDKLCLAAGQFAAYGAKLMTSASDQRKLAGKLVTRLSTSIATALAGAVNEGQAVYLVGDKPVLAAWGLNPVVGAHGPVPQQRLSDRENKIVKAILAGQRPNLNPTPVPIQPIAPPVPIEPISPQPAEPIGYYQETTTTFTTTYYEVQEYRGSLWWLKVLLSALIVFLLLLLLAFLFFPSLREAVGVIHAPPMAAWDDNRDDQLALAAERDRLRDEYLAFLASCTGGAQDLVIPLDAEDLTFLEGCWASDPGLVNSNNKLPLIFIYCFDKSGNAQVYIEEKDKNNRTTDICVTTATAVLEGNTLGITDHGPPQCQVNTQRRYQQNDVTCVQGRVGKADCTIKPEKKDPLHSPFTRLEGGPPELSQSLPTEPPKPKIQNSPLELPQDEESGLSFLEGCWESEMGLIDDRTGMPVSYRYCFDTAGNARIIVEEKDSSGKVLNICNATGVAKLESGVLTIQDSGAMCLDGESGYVPTLVTCKAGAQGKADCEVKSEGGNTIPTIFTHVGS